MTPSHDRPADRVGHTAGPWFAHGYRRYAGSMKFGSIAITTEPEASSTMGAFVADVRVTDDHRPEREANAHLISAAPELLASLKEVSDMLFARPDMVAALRPLMGFGENAICDRASAAIARAEGRS